MAQRLRKLGVAMCEMSFASPKNCTDMAVAFVIAMNDGILHCYEDGEGRLRRDFGKFNIEHKPPSKYKLIAISDEHGHADVGTALVIALPRAVELLGRFGRLSETDVLAGDDAPLSDEEVAAMPRELREIYEDGGQDDEYERPARQSQRAMSAISDDPFADLDDIDERRSVLDDW